MVNRAPVPRNAALCGGHRAIRSILGGAHGHCVPSAPPKDAAPIAGAGSLKLTFLFEKNMNSQIFDFKNFLLNKSFFGSRILIGLQKKINLLDMF